MRRLLVALPAVLLVVAACTGDEGDGNGSESPAPSVEAAPITTAVSAAVDSEADASPAQGEAAPAIPEGPSPEPSETPAPLPGPPPDLPGPPLDSPDPTPVPPVPPEPPEPPAAPAPPPEPPEPEPPPTTGEPWPDFVPRDLEWEPATILIFDSAVNEIVPVYDAPDGNGLEFYDGDVWSTTEYGNPLVVRVIQGSEGDEWAEVELPARPNGSRGWIRAAGLEWFTVEHHMFADLSERSLALFDGDELVLTARVIVGKEATPTPTLDGFLVEKLPNHDHAYGSVVLGDWILALSFFSEALYSFGGKPGYRIAVHGTHIPERLGEALSNGGLRLDNEVVELIAHEAPLGTIVRIVD